MPKFEEQRKSHIKAMFCTICELTSPLKISLVKVLLSKSEANPTSTTRPITTPYKYGIHSGGRSSKKAACFASVVIFLIAQLFFLIYCLWKLLQTKQQQQQQQKQIKQDRCL